MTNHDFAHLLLALTHLLVAAHGVGFLFERFKQPRVVGEIVGGILVGPTVFGVVAPEWFKTVLVSADATKAFSIPSATKVIMDAVGKLGLLLLMFCSGMEMRAKFAGIERRAAASITVFGTIAPFGVAMLCGRFVDFSAYYGDAATPLSFNLLVAIAVAITSIPVISKIMLDLGVLDTPFARIVLSAAVIEDVILYVVLSIALSLSRPPPGENEFGLPVMLGIGPGAPTVWYHVVATLGFFALAVKAGPRLFDAVAKLKYNVVLRASPSGYLLAYLLIATGVAMFLGVNVMFGAFLAGVAAASSSESADEPRRAVKHFASAFFIPIYFALVGVRLNLLLDVPWLFFALFLAACCAVKAASVFLGARIAGVGRDGSWNLAVAMNARGGPGIMLATVALDAHLIDVRFYACLVLLAIFTSLFAGTRLGARVRAGRPLL